MRASAALKTGMVVAAGLLLVWALRRFQGFGGALATPIADWWVRVTTDEPIQASGAVVLPDGRRVPLTGLSVRFDALDRAVFGFEGITYQVKGRRADGDYDAVRITA